MKDYGHDPDWYTDASGNRYHRKPASDRHPLLGPGIGDKRVDGWFDKFITAVIVVVGVVTTVGLLRTLPENEPTRPPSTIAETDMACWP